LNNRNIHLNIQRPATMVLTSYHNITSPLTSSQTTIGSGLMSHGIEKTQTDGRQVQRRHIQTGNGTPLPLTS
jgi:hypothetical protein